MEEGNRPEETVTQKLQNKVDKMKVLNMANNVHSLTPPAQTGDDPARDIALVKALSVNPRIMIIIAEIRGLEFNEKTKEWVEVIEPIMNFRGAYRFSKILKNIAQETEWASFSEEEIPARIIHYYEENLPYILFWADLYELDDSDFNYIETTLKSFIDSCFHKSKSGKYINTLSRTYDEGILKRALDTDSNNNRKQEGFLAKWNPLKERK